MTTAPDIVLLGPHGAGKTTLGRRLAHRLGRPFHDEIGRTLAEDPSWRPIYRTALDPQYAFDREVFRLEIARDADDPGPRVVETWHPGNLAFAEARSPGLARELRATLPPWRRPVIVLPLQASERTLHARQTEAGDPRVYAAIGRRALVVARELDLPVAPPLATDDLQPDDLVDLALRHLEILAWNPSI